MSYLSSLRHAAIILDGPLAVFGQPAWLSAAIEKELKRLNHVIRAASGADLLLLGIEKGGVFADHFMALDCYENGSPGRFPANTAALLDDMYIKRNIVFQNSNRLYGRQTYFGRKFFL